MSSTLNKRAAEQLRDTELSASERHRLLSSKRRRLVLDLLDDRSDSLTLQGLAEDVTRRESSGNPSDQAAAERVAIALHHDHLPKLAAAGVLDYDTQTREIVPLTDQS